jgi:hypothetical protein
MCGISVTCASCRPSGGENSYAAGDNRFGQIVGRALAGRALDPVTGNRLAILISPTSSD